MVVPLFSEAFAATRLHVVPKPQSVRADSAQSYPVTCRAADLLTAHGWKRLVTEGHTVVDAILTVAMAQIVRAFLPHMLTAACTPHVGMPS